MLCGGEFVRKKVMDKFLAHGVRSGASDLHFLVGNRPSYRIDGALRPVKYERLSSADTQQICENLLSDETMGDSLAEIQERDCSYSIAGVARFRVNIYRQRGSLCCVLRVIPTTVPSLAELGLPDRVQKLAEQERAQFHDRAHFLSLASRVMRRILVDHARARGRAKRGSGWQRLTLSGVGTEGGEHPIDLLALEDALVKLAGSSERTLYSPCSSH